MLIGYWLNGIRHKREMAVKMIEIALGILTAKPEPENKALREWAVNILVLNSPKEAPLSAGAKQAMLSRPLPYSSATFDAAKATKTIFDLGKDLSA